MQKLPLPHYQNSSTNTPYTMSSSASITPQVEPQTTIKTKSSFSEIEQLVDPHHTSKNYSYVTSQLQIHHLTEPFVSPLTETNLNYHKSTFPPSREAKHRYVDSFIQNQKVLLEQELELQRKTKAEIQSMIPLDTQSIDEELVRDDQQQQLWNGFLWSLAQSPQNRTSSSASLGAARRRHSTLAQHRFSSNHEEQHLTFLDTAENEEQSAQHIDGDTKLQQTNPSKKQWMKTLTRWIRLGQLKKQDECVDNDCEQQQEQQRQEQPVETVAVEAVSAIPQQENESLDLHADPSMSSSSAPTPAPGSDGLYGPNRQTNERQARKAARHVSWSGGTSFEKYKQQKSSMIKEGLYGLSNANIARALGSSQQGSRAPFLFLPTRDTTTSSSYSDHQPPMHAPTPTLTPTPTPDLHVPADSHTSSSVSTNQKKDPSISFVQQTLSSAKSLLRPSKSMRKKSNHVDPQEPQIPLTDNSNNGDGHGDGNIPLTNSRGDILQQQQQQQQIQTAQKQEKERRRRSTHVSGRYSPSLSALMEEDLIGTTGPYQTLVAFRYPKMVRIKDLRDAAIHILSTSHTGDEDEDDMDYMTMDGHSSGNGGATWVARDKAKWKTGHNDGDSSDGEHDDEHDLDRCARQYRNSIKRFSDPGTGLSARSFSIGRPISSLYN